MSNTNRPRYHNSPKQPKTRWRLPEKYEEMLIQCIVCALAIVTSPLWIPLFLVALPVRLWRENREQRIAMKRREQAAINPKPVPTQVETELEKRRKQAKRKKELTPLRDPISDDPAYSWAIEEAWRRAKEEIAYKQLGDCHRIWRRQKQILKEEFDIEWFTPSEMNPNIIFD